MTCRLSHVHSYSPVTQTESTYANSSVLSAWSYSIQPSPNPCSVILLTIVTITTRLAVLLTRVIVFSCIRLHNRITVHNIMCIIITIITASDNVGMYCYQYYSIHVPDTVYSSVYKYGGDVE